LHSSAGNRASGTLARGLRPRATPEGLPHRTVVRR
jgi:hypothetical protein